MKSHESNPCLQQLCLAKKIQKGDKILKRWQFWWQHKAGTASHTCASHWHITSLPITLHINCNSLALRINITSKSEKHDALNSYMYLYRNMSISDIKHKIPEIQLLYNYIYIILIKYLFRKSSDKSAIWRYFCWFASKTTWLCPSAARRQGCCNNCNLRMVKSLKLAVGQNPAATGEFMGDLVHNKTAVPDSVH